MKKAALVIGKPNAGKSTTIRKFIELMKKRGEMHGLHVFTLNGKYGFIYLTSFEEYDRDVDETIDHLTGDFEDGAYDYLIFACQGPLLADVHRALKKASFIVRDINVQRVPEPFKKTKEENAEQIFRFLNSN